MRVIVAGGTGFIGKALCRSLAGAGMDVTVLSRGGPEGRAAGDDRVRTVRWDARTPEGWEESLERADAVVNLVGENIGGGRWNREHKERILASRVQAARAIVRAITQAQNKPKVMIQGSAVGYYGDRGDECLDETSDSGSGFLPGVVRQVEEAAEEVRSLGVRLVLARTGVVLGRHAGMLPRLMRPFRFFVGGPPGSGKQWVSWVHIDDEVGALRFLLERADLSGLFNLTAPGAVRMGEFCRALGEIMGRPSRLRTPAFLLRLLFGREMADEILLGGARVEPKRLVDAGYSFAFPQVGDALRNLLP